MWVVGSVLSEPAMMSLLLADADTTSKTGTLAVLRTG